MYSSIQPASSGSLPAEMLRALVVTLPKSGKDAIIPQNFRPISLLNMDLKVYAKVIATRMAEVTPSLIAPDQMGFVKGHQAPDGTCRILYLFHLAERRKLPTAFIALDAEKAFDRIHWGYLQATLTKFGFRGFILLDILALYTNPSAQVSTSSVLSDTFNITNGTRQGFPFSPLIFTLVMEPFAAAIRSSLTIKGISVAGKCHKIGLFTDNIVPEECTMIGTFSAISYYQINVSKCHVLTKKNVVTKYRQKWNLYFLAIGITVRSNI